MQVIKKESFNNIDFNIYGTIEKPYFRAKEVGEILGLSNIRYNLSTIPEQFKSIVSKTYTLGGPQKQKFS